MSILNHVAFIAEPKDNNADFLEKLSSEGFSYVVLAADDDAVFKLENIHSSATLVSEHLDVVVLARLIQQIKERFKYSPVILVADSPEGNETAVRMLSATDGICYSSMPPAHIAAQLRGTIRTALTIQELMHANLKLNEISITDALTGLHNRGYMMERLSLEFKRAVRNREPLSSLMIDLDHFKQINDTYGHKFGDAILRTVADRLKKLIRETDIFGRYGGEEFLILLPNTNLEGATFLAEKLRAGLEEQKIEHDCFSLLVTASFGVSSTENSEVITADHLLQLADRALYKAKESGRNRVCVAGARQEAAGQAAREAGAGGTARSDADRVDVVSMHPESSRLIEALRKSEDYQIQLHASEAEFLTAFKDRSLQMVIIDQAGDGIEGIELCRRLKKQLQDLFVPMVILMPTSDEARRDTAFRAGADDVVAPELSGKEFLARLRLMSHLKKLHDRWRTTYQDLNMARTRLVKAERLNALGEMASGIAHDFNNILSAILGRAQILRQRTEDQAMLQNLAVIEKAANDGAATIRRIQEFSRSTADRAYQIVDVAQIVQDCIQMTRTRWKDQAESKGYSYRFNTRFAGELTVFGNQTELREVVTNLIMNALDAMPKGGEITFDGSVVNNEVNLMVSDTGEGMDEPVLKRIFDPFFSTKKGEGTGLGLSVTYGILMRHNGRIECTSTKGQGTTFRIQLPHKDRRSLEFQTGEIETLPRREAKRNLSILVVDDEPTIREIFQDILTQEGHEVLVADSGRKALEILANQRKNIDLLFTDLSMPEMSGWEVARQVRKVIPDIVIVLTSGWGKDFNQDQIHTHGVDFVLPKPVPFDTLQTLVRQVASGQPISLSL